MPVILPRQARDKQKETHQKRLKTAGRCVSFRCVAFRLVSFRSGGARITGRLERGAPGARCRVGWRHVDRALQDPPFTYYPSMRL